MLTRPFAIALLAVSLASPLSSQRLTQRAGLTTPAHTTPATRSVWVYSRRDVAPTNWLKGAVIGGGIGFVFGYLVSNPGDRDSPGATAFILKSTFLCAVLGAFIGSASKKDH